MPTPTPTAEPTPTATPTPTPTPEPTPPPLPPESHPTVVFLGDVAAARQAEITALTLDIVTFFWERLDARTIGFTLYFVADAETGIEKMTEVLGHAPALQCSIAEGNVVFFHESCAESWIAHEYFHALQTIWAPEELLPASETGWERGAWWLIEGSAYYAQMRYLERMHRDNPNYHAESVDTRRRLLSFDVVPLRDAETYFTRHSAGSEPLVAALAIDWIAGQTGEAAVINYFRLLPESTDWRTAFRDSFDMTTDEFYEAFEAHAAEVIPVRREIRGVVLGPDGEPVTRWRMDVLAQSVDSGRTEDGRDILFGGVFGLLVPDGSYELWVRARCAHSSPFIGWYGGEAGVLPSRDQAEPVVVAGSDVRGIEIKLRVEPSEMFTICDFGPLRTVGGTVVGPDGRPLRGVRVDAWDRVRYGALGRDQVLTGADGSFVLQLPDGTFSVVPLLFREREPGWITRTGIGWLALSNYQYAMDPTVITVDGADVSGVRIQILTERIHPTHFPDP